MAKGNGEGNGEEQGNAQEAQAPDIDAMKAALEAGFNPRSPLWQTHYIQNSRALPLGFAAVTQMEGFDERGTTGLSYDQIIQVLGNFIFNYELTVGQATGANEELAAYGRALAGGRAFGLLQRMAEKGEVELPELIGRLGIEGLNSVFMTYGTAKPQELSSLLAQYVLATSVPLDDMGSLEALAGSMGIETASKDLPGKILGKALQEYHNH